MSENESPAAANQPIVLGDDEIFDAHLGGKISIGLKTPLDSQRALSIAYTPGVAQVSRAIAAEMLMMRKQRFLLWLAAGYIVSSLTLSTQGLMNNQQLAQWSIITGASYLGSFWSMAHGVALRSGRTFKKLSTK